jgi:AraC family transcriptional regulator of adaptative response/methylated-DNA-[protein]-cysteine methyltransferase
MKFERKTRSAPAGRGTHDERQEEPMPQAMSLLSSEDSFASRYEAIRRRDPRAEGRFFYSVATTGVYCRPTCAARLARPENVAFHGSVEDAERAGFRPCRRCRPRAPSLAQRQAGLVARARRLIDEAETPPTLAALGEETGLSPFHLQRTFKRLVGVTPRQYAAALRLARVNEGLRRGASVTEALHQAGYSSTSRFYESDSGALGMTASDVRRGGEGLLVRAVVRPCALGRVLVAATTRGLCLVALDDDEAPLRRELHQRFPAATLEGPDQALEALADGVVALVDGTGSADLPLDLMGTAFQQRVWRALRRIPAGTTTTYGELARRIGAPGAARAVGTACGQNPIAVAVPCHRVLRGDGDLGGYRWGLPRKRALLARERGT